MHWVDQHQLGAFRLGVHQNGHGVRAGSEDVLSPQQNVPGIQKIENVVAFSFAEIQRLSSMAAAGADISPLCRDRAELFKEIVGENLQKAQRTAAAIVKDCRGTRL